MPNSSGHLARHWHALSDGRIQCDVCPRDCKLQDGQRGACFVRLREGDHMVLDTWGRSSGFCVDPIEKKPLNHFLPGSSVLSFGTAGCNLFCTFCQNWDISKSRETDTLGESATPGAIARAARDLGCASVAFTYNDPVVFLEYALDTADACHEAGLRTVAVTNGYMHDAARREMYAKMDAANVDLKGFTEEFYRKVTSSELKLVLETLEYIHKETSCWLEITTLLIPGLNDSDEELHQECAWIREHLGANVPVHFTAFHPDFKMLDRMATPPQTLRHARRIALDEGLHFVYTGNVHDPEGDTTSCPGCHAVLIRRDWYEILEYRLTPDGACPDCGATLPGRFAAAPGTWGARRLPVSMARWSAA